MKEGENGGLSEKRGLVVAERHRNEEVGFFVGDGYVCMCVICKVSERELAVVGNLHSPQANISVCKKLAQIFFCLLFCVNVRTQCLSQLTDRRSN